MAMAGGLLNRMGFTPAGGVDSAICWAVQKLSIHFGSFHILCNFLLEGVMKKVLMSY